MHADTASIVGGSPRVGFHRGDPALGLLGSKTRAGGDHLRQVLPVFAGDLGAVGIAEAQQDTRRGLAVGGKIPAAREHAGRARARSFGQGR